MMRKHLHKHSRAYAVLLGAIVGLIVLAGGSALAVRLVFHQVDTAMSRAEDEVTQIRNELQTTFVRLNARESADQCTEQGLIRLRALIMDLRFVREIGLYDAQGRLFCTSGVGKLREPFFETPSSMINSQGQIVWMDVPLIMADGQTRATIIRDGSFNLVLDPQLSRSFQVREGIDAIWFVTGHRVVPVGLDGRISESLKAELAEQASRTGDEALDWYDGQAVMTRRIAGSDYVIQSVLAPRHLLMTHRYLALELLCLAAIVAWLSYFAAIPRLRLINSLATRARALVSEKHIRCVYQPIVELATGKAIGCEVLMRIDDDGQVVFPDQLIPHILRQGLS